MATIEKRAGKGGTTWRVRVRRLAGPPLTKSFARKIDAEEWARSIEHKIDTGEHVPTAEARKRTVSDAIDQYLRVTLPQSKHQKNAAEQTRLLNWWKAELGTRTLVTITPVSIHPSGIHDERGVEFFGEPACGSFGFDGFDGIAEDALCSGSTGSGGSFGVMVAYQEAGIARA